MSDNLNKDKIDGFSQDAMKRITEEGLNPTPEIYHLWYAYYAGTSTEVRRAIDILIKNKKEITLDRCLELYHRFLGNNQHQEILQKAGNIIFSTLEDVTDVMQGVKTASTEYSGSMKEVESKLSKTSTIEEFQAAVNDAVSHTKKVLEENKKLESQIEDSSSSMDALRAEMESVRREALTDGLTGLNNRKSFDERFQMMIDESVKEGKALSLLMMDIDYFKSFNDTFGHQVGDQVLRLVARTLTDGVKGRDFVARYGGEEFTVILPETNNAASEAVANNLRQAVANKEVVNRTTGEKLGRITISVGVAQYNKGEKPAEFLERADKALYKAKENGRNRVERSA